MHGGKVGRRGAALAIAVASATALGTYLPGLGSLHAPTIGDEPLYVEIVHKTAASGRALPLLSSEGITDTKPPLLFWLGILATDGGQSFDLVRLRLTVVLASLATAAAAGFFAFRLTRNVSTATVAALVFLGFLSTIQHGRTLLTNAGETLFLFLPLALILGRRSTGLRLGLLAGASLGIATLYKSILLLVPGVLGLGLVLLSREGMSLRGLARRHGLFLLGATAVGVGIFMLWPLLDPYPNLVFSQFILGENVAKLDPRGWLLGLVSGEYPIWRTWLGDLANAGLYAPFVVALLVDLFRRRRELPAEERELWLFILAFIAVYSLPSQRQENYLLPTCPALAVLLALRWHSLPAAIPRVLLAVLALAATAVVVLVPHVDAALGPGLFGRAAFVLPALLALLAFSGALSTRLARTFFPHLVLGTLLAAWPILAPFSPPFPGAALAAVRGREVLVPSRFRSGGEMMRFVLPTTNLKSYSCPSSGPVKCPPPPPTCTALLTLDAGESLPEGWSPIAEVPALKQRHSKEQIARLLSGDLTLLAERLVLAEPTVLGRRTLAAGAR